jgi:hypothetical protein
MGQPPAPLSLEEFERLIEKRLEEKRRVVGAARYPAANQQELLWMALTPCWTAQLAERSGFPAQGGNPAQRLESMRKASLVKMAQVRSDEGESPRPPIYSLDETVRGDVLEPYTETPGGISEVQPIIAQIGGNILKAINQQVSNPPSFAPPAVARWAALAAHADESAELVAEFDRHVGEAFNKGASATIRDWMNSAQSLSALHLRRGDNSLQLALQRASQRLILLRRKENDERHLKYFYQRDEQLSAFQALMRGPDDQWALHFIGAGGVGKTMLVRKIAVEWASKEGAVTARVDFDYLKADYPLLDPGMLLWAFAQDLRAHANPDSIQLFNAADEQFARLSKRVRAEMTGERRRKRATDDPIFHQAISLYIQALSLIPKDILLIVDTCEELVKISTDRTAAENVEETFRILGAVHDELKTLRDEPGASSGGVPKLRVIFSGRRPLARLGSNWSCPSASLLDERPFLRLHEIRGFKMDEAAAFLREKMKVKEDLIPAIVKRSSPDTGSVAEIKWDDATKEETDRQTRCNPYDLRLYAEWAKEEPPPTAKEILASPGAAQYVELRIIRRLHFEPLKEMLPVIALLGHFDSRMLQEVFKEKNDAETIITAFDVLQQEEWINQHLSQDSEGKANLILDVEPGLRTRFFNYFRNNPKLLELQPRAASYLEEITLHGDLSTLDWSYFDAALSVLEIDPDAARVEKWWSAVEQRILSERPPEWVRKVTSGMQNEGSAAALRDPQAPPDAPPESRLRPAVLATHAAAILRSAKPAEINQTRRDLATIWEELLAKTDLYPSVKETVPLRLRAQAGLIASRMQTDTTGAGMQSISSFWQGLDDLYKRVADDKAFWSKNTQLAASLVAAAEATVEQAEKIALVEPLAARTLVSGVTWWEVNRWKTEGIFQLVRILSGAVEEFERLDKTGSGGPFPHLILLIGFVHSLAGRSAMFFDDYEYASQFFEQSLTYSAYNAPSSASPWFDWLPPDDIAARVRLEFVRAAYPSFMSAGEVLRRVGLWEIKLQSVDSERLHSALLRLRLAEGTVASTALAIFDWTTSVNGTLVGREQELVPGPDVCRAHHVTPPLCVTVSEVLVANGQADEALEQAVAVSRFADTYGYETLLQADRACANLIWRMRLRDVGVKRAQSLGSSPNVADRALFWALEAQDGPKNTQSIPQIPQIEPAEVPFEYLKGGRRLSGAFAKKFAAQGPELSESGLQQLRWEHVQKLRWIHAIWQTRYTQDKGRAEAALRWAEENLKPYLDTKSDDLPFYELASILLDWAEALLLSRANDFVIGTAETSNVDVATLVPQLETIDFDNGQAERGAGVWVRRMPDKETAQAKYKQPEQALTILLRALALDNRTDLGRVPFQETAVRLGLRRAAEIAWREGDLLALRFPGRAAILYDQALIWFKECGDNVGVFISGTSLFMTNARGIALAETPNLAQIIKVAYNGFQSGLKSRGIYMPSSEELNRWTGITTKDDVENDTPLCWRPWIARYMLSLLSKLSNKIERAFVGRRILDQNLRTAYSESAGASDLLPADLTNWMNEATRPATALQAFWLWARRISSLGARWALGVLVLLGFLYALLRGFKFLFSFLAPEYQSAGLVQQLITLAALSASAIFAYRLRYSFRSFRQSLDFLENQSDEDRVKNDFKREELAVLTRRSGRETLVNLGGLLLCAGGVFRYYFGDFIRASLKAGTFNWVFWLTIIVLLLLFFLFRRTIARELRWVPERYMESISLLIVSLFKLELTINTEQIFPPSYDMLAWFPEVDISARYTSRVWIGSFLIYLCLPLRRGIFEARKIQFDSILGPYQVLSEEFQKLLDLRGLRKFSMGVQVNLNPGPLNGVCWEALIPMDLANGGAQKDYLPFACSRKLTIITKRAQVSLSPVANVLCFSGTTVARAITTEGWAPALVHNETVFEMLLRSRNKWTVSAIRKEELLPLGNFGVTQILHLVGKGKETDAGVVFQFGEELSNLNLAGSSQELSADSVTAESITNAYTKLLVCIIQGEPQKLSSRRLERDRRDAFFTRSFASNIFEAGVPLVICIPSLAAPEAKAVIEILATLFARRKRLRRVALLKAIAEMKILVRKYASNGSDPAFAQELPHDLCVYLNDEWDGRMAS